MNKNKTFIQNIGLRFKFNYFPKTTRRSSFQRINHYSNFHIKRNKKIFHFFQQNTSTRKRKLLNRVLWSLTGNLISFQL